MSDIPERKRASPPPAPAWHQKQRESRSGTGRSPAKRPPKQDPQPPWHGQPIPRPEATPRDPGVFAPSGEWSPSPSAGIVRHRRRKGVLPWVIGAVVAAFLAIAAVIGIATSRQGTGTGTGSIEGDRAASPVSPAADPATAAADPATAAVEAEIAHIKRKNAWLSQYNELAGKTDDPREMVKGLERIDFIIRFDHEARVVVVDHLGWSVLTDMDRGRWLVTSQIANEMSYRQKRYNRFGEEIYKAHEVTLYSSKTGQSLSWFSPIDGEVHIFR